MKMLSHLTRVLIILTVLFSISHTYLMGGRIYYKKPAKCYNPNGKLGICISIDHCETLKSVLRNKIQKSYNFVQVSQCQNDAELPWNRHTFVCCSKDTDFKVESKKDQQHKIVYPTDAVTQSADPVNEDVGVTENNLQQQTLLPKPPDCGAGGITLVNKILGGVETELTEFSWMVHFEYRKANSMLVSPGCAGSLINNKYVVTAAHCIKGKIEVKVGRIESVIVGDHNTATDIDCNNDALCLKPAQRFGIESITVHESFDLGKEQDFNMHNDIALIRLDRNVNFTNELQPVCMPSVVPNEELKSDTIFTVAGWGHNGTQVNTAEKRKVVVPYVEQNACREKFLGRLSVADEQLCAGGVFRKDSCSGDSGGPLMRLSDGTWILEGIVSFGRGCGLERPAVYTRLRSYIDWIKNNVEP